MTARDMLLNQLQGGSFLYENFIKDLSDDDARFQPFPGGSHAIWLLMHVATTEDWVRSTLTGEPMALPAELHEKFSGRGECVPENTMTLADAWKLFSETRNRTMALVQEFPESRYEEPAPEGVPKFFPTMGAMLGLLGTHQFWHFGQLTFNRRMRNKKLLLAEMM